MRLLWIATKAPHPPVDGGRLLLGETLAALAAAGVELTLVAPVDPGAFDLAAVRRALADRCRPVLLPLAPRSRLQAALRSRLGGAPLAVARHARRAVRRAVESELAGARFDAVVAEQLHALPQAEPARRRGVPTVLRAQNVESELWRLLGARRGGPTAALLRREAARLARFEGAAVRGVDLTVALSARDAEALRALGGDGARVATLPAPFPPALPPGGRILAGAPAIVLFGSEGWPPNRDATEWFLAAAWPAVRDAVPGARLHLFGADPALVSLAPAASAATASDDARLELHPPPADSAEAYAPGALLALPLRVASGIRMRILEAWARGVAVLATPEAAAGLGAEDGRELLLAADADGFARGVARLAREPELAARLVTAGRARLAAEHAPSAVAARWRGLLDELLTARSGAR